MPEAARALSNIGKANQRLIVHAIDSLAFEPRPNNSKLLVNAENLRRLTIGDYRVIYGISEQNKSVMIELVRPRNRGYHFLAAFALTVRSRSYSK